MQDKSPLKVTLLGCGVVGSQVAKGLISEANHLAARIGAPVELTSIVVRDPEEIKDPGIPKSLLTNDAEAAVDGADVVIELFGGLEPAKTLILRALANGSSVVTANKALLAAHGPELYAAADAAGVDLLYEASVGGAIPIVRPIRHSLAGDHVNRILGIVNGTTNFILDRMTTDGSAFDDALKVAQERGFAEANPSADVDGLDAAAKAAILASMAFHTRVSIDDVAIEGIRGITADDVAWAAQTGQVLKLLAIAERTPTGVSVRVHPALIPAEHPLAAVRGAFNAVFVEAQLAGPLMFYGQGAGGVATSSAVLGDLVTVARHRVLGGRAVGESAYAGLAVLEPGAAVSRYQIRMVVDDQPGVLAQVAGVLAAHHISIEKVSQTPITEDDALSGDVSQQPNNGAATLVITTHAASGRAFAEVRAELAASPHVIDIVSVLRVEGGGNG